MNIDFWTSTEYGGFMKALMKELSSKGLNSKQKFNISENSYRSSVTPLQRFILRFKQYVIYPLQLIISLIGSRLKHSQQFPIVVATNTFYAPLVATFFNKKVIHLVYDLFPEAMIHSGKWKEGGLRVKFFRWIVNLSLARSATNVFLGERLKEYVEFIHGDLPNSEIIHVGADESPFLKLDLNDNLDPITILYCGNFGNMHESQTLFDAWELGRCESLRFLFHCSGPKRNELELFYNKNIKKLENYLKICDGLPYNDWVNVMKSSHIALVTMKEGSQNVVMPSKTYSAMMAGQAILAVAPENSDLVDLIKKANCGWWVNPGDSIGLYDCLTKIYSDKELLKAKRLAAYNYAHENFGQKSLSEEWEKVIRKI